MHTINESYKCEPLIFKIVTETMGCVIESIQYLKKILPKGKSPFTKTIISVT